MLKVALVGVGGISGTHIPAWDAMDDVELVALCDIRPEQMTPYTTKHCYTNFKEMLEKETIDILDICLPTYMHTEYSIMAMEKGIHVICEKPVSLQKEDVKKLYDAAAKYQVTFMIAQVVRFWPGYVELKEIYDSGKYGKLLSGSMRRLGSTPKWSWDGWMFDEKRSGLVPFDLHIHDLDYIVSTFGKPKTMQPFRVKRPEQYFLQVVYEFDDFFINTEAAWYAAPYPFTCNFRFQFEEAIVALENNKFVIYENNGTIIDTSKVQEESVSVINLSTLSPYADEIRYFTDCVKAGKTADKIKPEELEAVLAFAAQLS